MDAVAIVNDAWKPYEGGIRATLEKLARLPLPEETEFLWFVLQCFDLRSIPIIVWPTDRYQQQQSGWENERDLMECVPESVELPDELTENPENMDLFRDACAFILTRLWQSIDPMPDRLAYFSMDVDGWFFSLRDGRKISAWDIESEITRLVSP